MSQRLAHRYTPRRYCSRLFSAWAGAGGRVAAAMALLAIGPAAACGVGAAAEMPSIAELPFANPCMGMRVPAEAAGDLYCRKRAPEQPPSPRKLGYDAMLAGTRYMAPGLVNAGRPRELSAGGLITREVDSEGPPLSPRPVLVIADAPAPPSKPLLMAPSLSPPEVR